MVTPREEYLSKLGQIQLANQNGTYFPIPEAEKIYKIDLNTRRCEAPSHLSVTDDHMAEILFFEVDRYFDKQDLAAMTCVISYINASGEYYIYPVPCKDTTTYRDEGKMLIPWVIDNDVTWGAGTVKFAFKFYEINPETLEYSYALSTMPTTTKVLEGMRVHYVEATEQAAADNTAGKWATEQRYLNYYTKVVNSRGDYRYAHATDVFDSSAVYYRREDAFRISDTDKLDAIYAKLDELSRTGVKWVEV